MHALSEPLLGAVYLVEPNLSFERQASDLGRMAEAGMNLVVLWPAISRWDAPDGTSIAFASIDKAMDASHKHGLKVILELEGQNPAFQFAPDFGWTPERAPQSDRARHWVNYFHPEVSEEIDAYVRSVAAHFKDHPALWGYDLFNEVNFHSTDPHTLAEFHKWLTNKYGEIKKLNHVWGRFFNAFEQVAISNFDAPYSKWSSLRPLLDFEEFRSDAIVSLIERWTKAVRSVDPEHRIIVDNSWSMTTFDTTILGNDDWKIAGAAEVFGLSVYPQSWDVRLREDPCAVAQIYRGGFCAGKVSRNRPTMVSELQTHNQTALAKGSSVFDEVKLWTWQAFAHGIEGLVYWKWNPFTRGFQVAGRGMTAPDGTPNKRAQQATEVAEVLKSRPDYFTDRVVFDSGVGLLYHPTCDRFTDLILPDEPGVYRKSFAGWYRYLWQRGINPTILQAGDLPNPCAAHLKLLVIPCQMMLSKEDAKLIQAFIKRGGKVVADGRFAIIDEDGFAYDEAPGDLVDAFGYLERDYLSPYEDPEVAAGERFCVVGLKGGRAGLESSCGDPVAVETDHTLYLATPFGLDIGNLGLSSLIDPFLLAHVDRRCEILQKDEQMDAVISHRAGARADELVMLAVTNYGRQQAKVRAKLKGTGTLVSLWPDATFEAEEDEGNTTLSCTVPARSVAGFILE